MSQTQSDFSIPYRSDDELKDEARKFLASYNPDNEVPVPIEHIAEYDLGISILPTKNLEHIWAVDAFINSRLDTIIIDEWAYMNQERAREVWSTKPTALQVTLYYLKVPLIQDLKNYMKV